MKTNQKKSIALLVLIFTTMVSNLVKAQNANDIFKHIDKIYLSDIATLKSNVLDTIQGEGGYSIRYESVIKINGFETIINEEFVSSAPYYIATCVSQENKNYSSVFEALKNMLVSRYKKLKLDDSNQSDTNHNIYGDLKRVISFNDQDGNELIILKLWGDGFLEIQIR
jgi:hypothetical protein